MVMQPDFPRGPDLLRGSKREMLRFQATRSAPLAPKTRALRRAS